MAAAEKSCALIFRNDMDDEASALMSEVVYLVLDEEAESPTIAFGGWNDGDFPAPLAAHARELARVHARVSDTLLPGLLHAEVSPHYQSQREAVLERRLQNDRSDLARVQVRIDVVLQLSHLVAQQLREAPDHRALLAQISTRFAAELDQAGMCWSARGSLAGWTALVDFALRQWQQQRTLLQIRCLQAQQELELARMQSDVGRILSDGAQGLLQSLKSASTSAPGSICIQENLRVHVRQPLTSSWEWLNAPAGKRGPGMETA